MVLLLPWDSYEKPWATVSVNNHHPHRLQLNLGLLLMNTSPGLWKPCSGQNGSSPNVIFVCLCLQFTCKRWPVKLEVMCIRLIHLYLSNIHIAIFKSCSFLYCPWSTLHQIHLRSGKATTFKYVKYVYVVHVPLKTMINTDHRSVMSYELWV